MFSAVTHSVSLTGLPASAGVDAWLWSEGGKHVALLADRPDNVGVSATNGYREYAQAVARAAQTLGATIEDIHWFEFDSTGAFDVVTLVGAEDRFSPVLCSPYAPRTKDAFIASARSIAPASELYWRRVLEELEQPSATTA